MKEEYKNFDWIHPDDMVLDCQYFSFTIKHIGFFYDDFVINYNHLYNKCDFDIKTKNKKIVINGIEQKCKNNYLKYTSQQTGVFPVLFDMINKEKINYIIIIEVYKDKRKNHLADILININYYPEMKKYSIIEKRIDFK